MVDPAAPCTAEGTGVDPSGGPTPAPGRRLAGTIDGRLVRRIVLGTGLTVVGTNLMGIVVVFAFAVWVLPGDPVPNEGRVVLANLLLLLGWTPVVLVVAVWWSRRPLRPSLRWLSEGRPPTEAEGIAVLRAPIRLFRIQMVMWTVSAVLFAVVNGVVAARLISRVGLPIILGGLTTCSIAYLTTERLFRPLATRVLAEGSLVRARLPGVTTRSLLTWMLGTGIPVVGLVVVGIVGLADADTSRVSLAVTMVAVGGTALAVGLWTTFLTARAVADPVRSVRDGMARVADGDLDVEIAVYDGSEVGLLQDGFNRMVDGLHERERIRDLFGRHVGTEVAAEAMAREPELGGDERDVAVLFVDVVESTRLASENPPDVVVDLLNRFFAVVVEVVMAHGGLINKFQGDAALGVFGAPTTLDDPAGAALAAGRELALRLRRGLPRVRSGVGVAYGPVVAGNLGARDRFEYTVIGDAVNEAARLTDLAKDTTLRVLASDGAISAAEPAEAARWTPGEAVVLRGRTAPTTVHAPRDDGDRPHREHGTPGGPR